MPSTTLSREERLQRIGTLLHRSYDDPERFSATVLGTPAFYANDPRQRPFWEMQRLASRLVVENHTCVFPWGNNLGKSWWLARLILWWCCTRVNSLTITTAPTFEQLETVLWKNIRIANESSLIPLGLRITVRPLRGAMRDGWGILGISTKKTERMSGHHNPQLLAVVDESSDVPQEIKEAIDSFGVRKLVTIGNPLRADGWFRDLAREAERQAGDPTIPASERIAILRVPSTASPHIGLDHSPYGMACRAWLNQKRREYGEQSLWWKTHVLAEFPDLSHDVLVPPEWFDRCFGVPAPEPGLGGPRRIAIDLSEGVGRDQTCVLVRDDLQILEVWHTNTGGLGEAARMARTFQLKYAVEPWRISYDALGIGKGFDNDLAGVGITGATRYHGNDSGGTDFANLRSQAAWNLRCRLDPDRTLDPPPDPRTGVVPRVANREKQPPFYIPPGLGGAGNNTIGLMREDLTQMRYQLIGRKIKLENKVDLCKRLGRSDDIGGSLLQSFAFFD